MPFTQMSAGELAEGIRRKRFSPVEVVTAYLEQISASNPRLNAFIRVDGDRALEEARRVEAAAARGDALGLLHGVPISIKSSVEVAGFPFEAGSRLRAGITGETDAPLVQSLKAAGAIVLGVTNVPEFLMAYETDNGIYGRTNSPWDGERTPGGSSGGEAAAIAAGLSAAGVGSDGGGSVRVPAHFSGICGLKPTPGRIPISGHFPPSGGPFALIGVVGPMARTVADLQVLLEVMSAAHYADPCAAPVPFRHAMAGEERKPRVAYFEDDGVTPVTAETRAAVRAAADALEADGYEVVPFRPQGLEEARRLWWLFFVVAAREVLGPMVSGAEAQTSPILREFLGIAARRPRLEPLTFLNAWLERDQLRTRILEQMQQFPILLCPVCAVPAFRHGERQWNIDGVEVGYVAPERDVMAYSQWFNLLGFPGVSVPVGRSPEGLPIGVQVAGRPWEEETILSVAAVLDRAFGYAPPPMIQQGLAGTAASAPGAPR